MKQTEKIKVNRYPKARLIVSVEQSVVNVIDKLIAYKHPANRNRSGFVRMVIVEKLEKDTGDYI